MASLQGHVSILEALHNYQADINDMDHVRGQHCGVVIGFTVIVIIICRECSNLMLCLTDVCSADLRP